MDYTKQLIVPALTALVVALLVAVLVPHSSSSVFGAATTPGQSGNPTTLPGGSTPTMVSAFEATESIVSDGPIVQLTSNTATTSAKLGCIQTTATSTATPVRLVIGSTQAASTTFQGTNSNFTVLAQYGTCPV